MVHSQFCLMLWPMCGCFWPESESWFCWYSNYNLWVRRKQMVPPLMGPLFGITPLNALAMEAPSLTMGSFFNYYFSFYDLIVSSTICHGYSCFTVWFWLCAFQPSIFCLSATRHTRVSSSNHYCYKGLVKTPLHGQIIPDYPRIHNQLQSVIVPSEPPAFCWLQAQQYLSNVETHSSVSSVSLALFSLCSSVNPLICLPCFTCDASQPLATTFPLLPG